MLRWRISRLTGRLAPPTLRPVLLRPPLAVVAWLPWVLAAPACGGAHTIERYPGSGGPSAVPSSPLASVRPLPPSPSWPAEDGAAIPISPRNPTWGSRTALVTIVEFSDLECPYCARVQESLAHLQETYGPETLRIVWKNDPLPFHPNARPAAEAAMAVFARAGAEGFWKFLAMAFADQGSLNQASYLRWAVRAGIRDPEGLRADLEAHAWAEPVASDVREANGANVKGTPSFYINGVFVSGAQPYDNFKVIVDEELTKARQKIAEGTPREGVYAELARVNHAAAAAEDDDQDEPSDTKIVFKVPVAASPVRGDSTAPVTIVEFADFQCVFCARAEETLRAVRTKYGNKVRIVWKNEPLPFHQNAEPAAQAALEVRAELGDAAFWSLHDKLFAAQQDLSREVLTRLAGELGADRDKVGRAITNHVYARQITADEDLVDDFRANGTPHFFINGRRLVGAQEEGRFDAIIDEEIVHATRLVSTGTAPGLLYEALVQGGQGPAEPERKTLPRALPAGEPVRGNGHAKVTLHEWGDFQCPFCGRVEQTVGQLMKDYEGRIRLVWHDMPLPMHADAALAAQAGREAMAQKGSTGFWALHDRMFHNQQSLKRSDLDDLARALQLDFRRWTASLDAGAHDGELAAEKSLSDGLAIHGVPAFVVVPAGATEGYFIDGAVPYGKFRRLIDLALSDAK